MARDHARIKVNVWSDPDWRKLPMGSQWLYLHLLSSPKLTYAGVGDWRPARIAAFCENAAGDLIESAAYPLEFGPAPFVVIDRDTEEALIRSFVRNDGLLDMPNVTIAAVKAWQSTASEVLRGVIAWELARAQQERPDAPGFIGSASSPWVEEVLCSDMIRPEEAASMLPENPCADMYEVESNPSDNPSGSPLRRVK